jgi:PAS domain S-box-containing protein
MDGHIQESNQAFVEMLGYTEEELRSMTYRDLTPAQWHEIQAEIVRTQVVPRGYSDLYEKEYRRKDGTIFPVELRTFLVRDDSGQPAAMWAIIRDISDRKRVEIELRESEERYRAVVEDQTEVISRFNTDGTLTFVNDVYCRFFGKARHELLGGTWRPRALAEDVPQVEQELRAMSPARPVVVIENRVYSGSGQVRWMQFVNRGFYDAQGRLLEIQGVGRDITERKRAVEALHELSGRLLRSQDEERRRIARELHDTTAQGLAALLMNLSLVKASAPGMSDKTWQLLAGAVALAEQCTRELRTVSYLLHPPMLDELGLAGAMRDYADGFARRSGLRIDLELPPNLEGLPRETALALFRVMQEALTNVHLHSGSRTASIRLGRTATELQLEVRDQGQGMEAARKLSAGDPPGGGLGVGVPGMRERMRQLGGRLEIESNERGTCVMAFAPVTGRAPAQLQP